MIPLLSVVIMAFNEENNLMWVTRDINTLLEDLNKPYEIIIVNDGSSDTTPMLADVLQNELNYIKTIHHLENFGLGEVYRSGFRDARGEFITYFPADGQFPATNINAFIPYIENFDLILGYIPDTKLPPIGRFLSKAERFILTILFGKLPRFQGIFMVRRQILNKVKLVSHGRAWMIVMELIIKAKKAGYRIQSIPIQIRPRISGDSKVNNITTIVSFLSQIIKLRMFLNVGE
ncbi:MAG: glycosyltransferase [Candidatus Omnitrophica bacterium]|nr:glycosyltransferase [Candidatus Omnitrophota bacterium]